MENKASIGGQALIEGIMMKGPNKTSVAIRKPDKEIELIVEENKQPKFKKIPVVRGMFNFFDSLITGYKHLMISSKYYVEDEEPTKFDLWLEKRAGKKSTDIITVIAALLGGCLALVLFMVLPTTITGLIDKIFALGIYKASVEGLLKMLIFFLYLLIVSRQKDIQRVFAYHGAEHKTISCYEAGDPLTVENVKKHTRFHPRCGTSFMLIVIVISILVFSFVPWNSTIARVGLKLLFLPVVVGISYEVLRFTGKHVNGCTKFLAAPGMWFQRLTTNEPEDDMIEVAIEAAVAVLPIDDKARIEYLERKKQNEIKEDILNSVEQVIEND